MEQLGVQEPKAGRKASWLHLGDGMATRFAGNGHALRPCGLVEEQRSHMTYLCMKEIKKLLGDLQATREKRNAAGLAG